MRNHPNGRLADAARTANFPVHMRTTTVTRATVVTIGVSLVVGLMLTMSRRSVGIPAQPSETLVPAPLNASATAEAPIGAHDRLSADSGGVALRLHVRCASSGEGVAGAVVRIPLSSSRVESTDASVMVGHTDDAGLLTVSIESLRAAQARMRQSGESVLFRVHARGFAGIEHRVTQSSGGTEEIILRRAGEFRITFTDADRVPVPGVRVVASRTPFPARSRILRQQNAIVSSAWDERSIIGGVSGDDGVVTLLGIPSGSDLRLHFDRLGYVSLDERWVLGGAIRSESQHLQIELSRIEVAVVTVPQNRHLFSSWSRLRGEPSLVGDVGTAVRLQKLAVLSRLEKDESRITIGDARILDSARKRESARLSITGVDGSHHEVDVPYHSVEEVLSGTVLNLDLPTVDPLRAARMLVSLRTSVGQRILGAPCTIISREQHGPRGVTTQLTRTPGRVVVGRTGDEIQLLGGAYVARIGEQVAMSGRESAVVECRPGMMSQVVIEVDGPLLPCRVRPVGPEADLLDYVRYTVKNRQGAAVASFSGTVSATEPQVWLAPGEYVVLVHTDGAGYQRREVSWRVVAHDATTCELWYDPMGV